MKLTISTPTFNRAHVIGRVYESLRKQTNHNFEWLVVDDGSTDNTEELIANFSAQETRFKITYVKRPRGGFNRALNFILSEVTTDFLYKIDSDDYVKPNAVEKILEWADAIEDNDDIVAIGIARCLPNGEYIKGSPPIVNDEGYVDATNLERKKYNLDADMSEAYKVKIIKNFTYPVWDTEMYAPESPWLNEIALAGYKVRWYAERLYVCDYHPGGITKGSSLLEKNNPMGFAIMYNHMFKYGFPFKRNFRIACQHVALSMVGGNPGYILKSNARLATFLALPFGLLLAVRRFFQFRNVR